MSSNPLKTQIQPTIFRFPRSTPTNPFHSYKHHARSPFPLGRTLVCRRLKLMELGWTATRVLSLSSKTAASPGLDGRTSFPTCFFLK